MNSRNVKSSLFFSAPSRLNNWRVILHEFYYYEQKMGTKIFLFYTWGHVCVSFSDQGSFANFFLHLCRYWGRIFLGIKFWFLRGNVNWKYCRTGLKPNWPRCTSPDILWPCIQIWYWEISLMMHYVLSLNLHMYTE